MRDGPLRRRRPKPAERREATNRWLPQVHPDAYAARRPDLNTNAHTHAHGYAIADSDGHRDPHFARRTDSYAYAHGDANLDADLLRNGRSDMPAWSNRRRFARSACLLDRLHNCRR